jgi:hypothetical protein
MPPPFSTSIGTPKVVPVHDRAAWRACTDRAGFQLAAAWLGTVDRVW